jgi:hypothetical protein
MRFERPELVSMTVMLPLPSSATNTVADSLNGEATFIITARDALRQIKACLLRRRRDDGETW